MPMNGAHWKWVALACAVILGWGPASGSVAAEDAILSLNQPLTFADADGRLVRSTDFPGKWLLVYFGYTHCAYLCPTGLSVLANALDQIGPAAEYVQPLFVTVDPERDKGPMLRTFTEAFDKRLIGLGGTEEQIRNAADALGIAVAPGSFVVHPPGEVHEYANGVRRTLLFRVRYGSDLSTRIVEWRGNQEWKQTPEDAEYFEAHPLG